MALCSEEGCDRDSVARGYCYKHYRQRQRHGTLPGYDKQCKVDGCDKTSYQGGYCNKHYLRVKRYGDENFVKRRIFNGTPEEVFLHYTDKKTETGCWLYRGTINSNGYGRLRVGRKNIYAHVFSYQRTNGVIPKGMVVRHKCRNRNCVNPEHLEIGTIRDNNQDKWRDGTVLRGEQVGSSKLTESAVRDILSSSFSADHFAAKYNVKVRNIYCVRARVTWKHVEV